MRYITNVDLKTKRGAILIPAKSTIEILHACADCGRLFISHTDKQDVALKTHVHGTFILTCNKIIE